MNTVQETAFEGESDNGAVRIPGGRAWRPQVHHIWDELLDQLLPLEGSGHTQKGSFPEFFRIVVDGKSSCLDECNQSVFKYSVAESLFSVSASNERKYWGFSIFKKALPRVKTADLPMLFTKNFMRTWINHLSHPDRYLHSFAKQIASPVIASAVRMLNDKSCRRRTYFLLCKRTHHSGSLSFYN
jgi:DNA polymerase phi